LDGTALGMTHDHDQFGADQFGRKFETAKDVVIDKVARHPSNKDVTNPLIKHIFRLCARIEAAHYGGKGKLVFRGLLDLCQEIPFFHLPADKAFVALFEHFQRLSWSDGSLCLLGECDISSVSVDSAKRPKARKCNGQYNRRRFRGIELHHHPPGFQSLTIVNLIVL
jgi:hypothetical protein